MNVIVATAVLHNIAIDLREEQPPQELNMAFDIDVPTTEALDEAFRQNDTSVRTALVNTVFSV